MEMKSSVKQVKAIDVMKLLVAAGVDITAKAELAAYYDPVSVTAMVRSDSAVDDNEDEDINIVSQYDDNDDDVNTV